MNKNHENIKDILWQIEYMKLLIMSFLSFLYFFTFTSCLIYIFYMLSVLFTNLRKSIVFICLIACYVNRSTVHWWIPTTPCRFIWMNHSRLSGLPTQMETGGVVSDLSIFCLCDIFCHPSLRTVFKSHMNERYRVSM